jgi:hypothetical protein
MLKARRKRLGGFFQSSQPSIAIKMSGTAISSDSAAGRTPASSGERQSSASGSRATAMASRRMERPAATRSRQAPGT